jgi:hypothetical protein
MKPILAILPAVLLALLLGCANRQLDRRSNSSAALSPAIASPEAPQWLVPTGWVTVEPPGPFQVAAFAILDGSGDAHVFVMALTNYTYGLFANVNRCREQVGLPPIDASILKDNSRPVKTASGDLGTAFRIVGKEKSILFAAFTRGEVTWFFKMTAPNALAERERDAFDHFIGSFRLSCDQVLTPPNLQG